MRLSLGINSDNNIKNTLNRYNLNLYNKMINNWKYCDNVIESDFNSFNEKNLGKDNLILSISRIFMDQKAKILSILNFLIQ